MRFQPSTFPENLECAIEIRFSAGKPVLSVHDAELSCHSIGGLHSTVESSATNVWMTMQNCRAVARLVGTSSSFTYAPAGSCVMED